MRLLALLFDAVFAVAWLLAWPLRLVGLWQLGCVVVERVLWRAAPKVGR